MHRPWLASLTCTAIPGQLHIAVRGAYDPATMRSGVQGLPCFDSESEATHAQACTPERIAAVRMTASLPYAIALKAILCAVLCTGILRTPVVAEPSATEITVKDSDFVPTGYKLSWSDEFTGNALDATKWDYRTDSKGQSTQLPANISVSDGLLHIALKKEEANGKPFTGGGVISKQAFKYGYYEARFRVPLGRGWHTSFWMMKHNGKGDTKPDRNQEIDVCEQDSVDLFRYSAGVIDWSGSKSRNFGREHPKAPNLAAAFHVWGCEFTPTEVQFFFDGKLTHQTDATKFPHGVQHIWLTSIAYPAGKPSLIDATKLPAVADFAYVRFYELK